MNCEKLDDGDQLEYDAWCVDLEREEVTEHKAKAHFKKLKRSARYSIGAGSGCRREKVLMVNNKFHVFAPADHAYQTTEYFPQCRQPGKYHDKDSTRIEDAWVLVVKFWRTV